MTRLTLKTREALLSDLLGHKFTPLLAPLVIEARHAATAIYESMFTPEALELMFSLPQGWMREHWCMSIYVGGQAHTLQFNGIFLSSDYKNHGAYPKMVSLRDFAEKEEVNYRIPHNIRNSSYTVPNGHLRDRFTAAFEAQERLNAQFRIARGQTDAALAQFTTIEKLIKEWPEVEPFAKKFIVNPEAPAKIQLPAIRPEVLNTLLDLPVDELDERKTPK